MKKINLLSYQVGEKPFDVKTSIVNLLFNPELKLTGRDVLGQYELVKKIEGSADSVLLEEAEYQKVKRAFDVFTGFSRNEVELVLRVYEAQEVPVMEVQK
jgi:hypothetical protein